MNIRVVRTAAIIAFASNFLVAGSCSGGACGGAVKPYIPSDIEESVNLKPFNISGQKQVEKGYKGWFLVDNAGDTDLGEYRFMAGIDANSLLDDGDKLSLFGLISSKNIYNENLKSGKFSYAYPLPWKDMLIEASYIHTNYSLEENIPGLTGIGTNRSIRGKLIYPFINSNDESLKFSLYATNNNIDEELTYDQLLPDNGKKSYSGTAQIDYKTKKYPIFGLDASHKLSLSVTSGNLTFNDEKAEEIDKIIFDTQGSYTKMNLDYKNILSLSESISLESKFRGQYAFNDKNLDDSESFVIGGINGVKVYEESATYDSNGFVVNIEGKYKLPEFASIKNDVGLFYDYGRIWASDPFMFDDDDISLQDAGIGIYTRYKKFFSRVQAAYEIGDSDIPIKDDKNYRVLFQAGVVF